MNVILNNNGLIIDCDEFIKLYTKSRYMKFQKYYTIKYLNKIVNVTISTKMYSLVKDTETGRMYMILPRFTIYDLYKKNMISSIKSNLTNGKDINMTYIGKSNYNQNIIIDHVINNIFPKQLDEFKGCTLKVMAGLGKTYIAMDIISKINKKTLIIVPNTYLLEQWVQLLKQYFPNNTIGVLYCKKKVDGDIIVAIINSVVSCNSFIYKKELIDFDDILQKTGLVIFDESQSYVSKTFRSVYKKLYSNITIGLSATPDIKIDGLDRIHVSNIGPILDAESIDGYEKSLDMFISEVMLVRYQGPDEHTQFILREDGLLDYQNLLENIITDERRNLFIIDKIIEMVNMKLNIFIFSDRRSHIENLYDLLIELVEKNKLSTSINLPESNKSIILYGGVKKNIIQEAQNYSKIIFTTYQYSSTGVSIIKMNGLILATPRTSNMKQIINRIFRLGSDQNVKRYIIDIIDNKTPLKHQYRKRLISYKDRNCEIKFLDY
jgi:superfamily II DNA or RNA helicase